MRESVRALIYDNDHRFLIVQHNEFHARDKGKWSIPGGGLEKHDTSHTDAIKREIGEEFGAHIPARLEIQDLVFTNIWPHRIDFFYLVKYTGTENDMLPIAHDEILTHKWVHPYEMQGLPTYFDLEHEIALEAAALIGGARGDGDLTLELPSLARRNSFIAMEQEFAADGKREYEIEDLENDFEKFLRENADEMAGRHLPTGFVPQTTWWMIANDEVVGRISFRHRLNEFLQSFGGNIGYEVRRAARRKGYATAALDLTLKRIKLRHGLKEVLLTCSDDNTASIKTIEKNHGELIDKIIAKPRPQTLTRRYRIKI